MHQEIRTTLKAWDGKDTAALDRLYDAIASQPGFQEALVELCAERGMQIGATWLLKRGFDETGRAFLSEALSTRHVDQLIGFEDWQAQLHALQYLEKLALPNDASQRLRSFVLKATGANNRFVRAWAFYSLATLAVRFPEFRTEFASMLAVAGRVETAGSIKVRIRKALEKIKRSSG